MNTTQQRLSSGLILAVAAWVTWISFTQKPADAFLFPRLISVFFLVFSAWTAAKAFAGKSKTGKGLSIQEIKTLTPGLIIAIIFVFWAVKTLGFYTASGIAFFLMLSIYDPAPHSELKSWFKRVVISAGYIAIMYGLFSVLLNVFTPRGLFI